MSISTDRIAAEDREAGEFASHPRGNRLTVQPLDAPGVGRDEPDDEPTTTETK